MTRKEQNKILNDKIESNVNQYKVDRLNAEISAFSSGDLNKYEFLERIDLNYKPNALDKARFEFSPLGKTFNTGLDKTAQGYQEEGITKLLKDLMIMEMMIMEMMIMEMMIMEMMIMEMIKRVLLIYHG